MQNKILQNRTAVIVEDHKIFSESFAMLLERTGVFSEIHNFDTEQETISFFVMNANNNVCLFLDYFIPNCNTTYLLADIRRFCPSVRVIIISSLTNPSLIRKLLLNKVDGFISKTDGTEEILSCLRSLLSKEIYYSNKVKEILANSNDEKMISELTSRELEILTYLSKSHSVEQISQDLNLSKHTVITHRRNMLTKTGCHSVTELVAYGLRSGLIAHD